MTRVRSRANPDRIGTTVGDAPNGDVMVEWDGCDGRWRIAADQLETIKDDPSTSAQERNIHLALLDALDRLRDSFNLAIECCIRDIQREMKK